MRCPEETARLGRFERCCVLTCLLSCLSKIQLWEAASRKAVRTYARTHARTHPPPHPTSPGKQLLRCLLPSWGCRSMRHRPAQVATSTGDAMCALCLSPFPSLCGILAYPSPPRRPSPFSLCIKNSTKYYKILAAKINIFLFYLQTILYIRESICYSLPSVNIFVLQYSGKIISNNNNDIKILCSVWKS